MGIKIATIIEIIEEIFNLFFNLPSFDFPVMLKPMIPITNEGNPKTKTRNMSKYARKLFIELIIRLKAIREDMIICAMNKPLASFEFSNLSLI